MALADFADFKNRVINPDYTSQASQLAYPSMSANGSEQFFFSGWQDSGGPNPYRPGTNPSTAVALDYTGANGLSSHDHPPAGSRLMIAGGMLGYNSGGTSATMMLVDRLSHQGGLVGNVDTLQTTNLPTAALTRYTDGVGVWCGMHFYSTIGSTDVTITFLYTNQAGTGSRTGTISYVSTPVVDAMSLMQMEAPDTGVRSVESIQLDVTSGSAGNMGITLFKPLSLIGGGNFGETADQIAGWNEPIDSEAHLELLGCWASTEVVGRSPILSYMDP